MICEINTIVISIFVFNEKKMICALMFIISNHYEIKCFGNLLQLEACNGMCDFWHNDTLVCNVKYNHYYCN